MEQPRGRLFIGNEQSIRAMTFEDMLDEQGYIVYTNVGKSMLPLLRERRDIVEIRKKGRERCSTHDVVLYRNGSKYILHRVIKVRGSDYVIMGDNNTFLERGITDEQILGVMTRVIRDHKSYPVDNWQYRAYVLLWCAPWPARMLFLKARSRLSSLKHRLL